MKRCENCYWQPEAEFYTGKRLHSGDKGFICFRCISHPKNKMDLIDAFEPRKECGTCGNTAKVDMAENEALIENTCKKCRFAPREYQNDSWIPRPEDAYYEK